MILELKNISKSFTIKGKKNIILNEFDLTLQKNDSLGVVGRNGAGKSTFLGLVSGIIYPDTGTIKRFGSISWPIGRINCFQGSLTGKQNCYFICKIYYGEDKDKIKKTLQKIESFADIGSFFDKPVKSYSAGMRSRLIFGVSLFIKFDIYLIDEITAAGDQQFRKKAYQAFLELKESSTIIMVSHNLNEIKKSCNKLIWIKDGNPVFYNNVEKGINDYNNFY